MKKVILLCITAITAIGCNQEQMKYGQGGRNACQYVREQIPEQTDNVERVEVIGEDSLLGTDYLSTGDMMVFRAETDYYENRISRQRLDAIIDSVARSLQDVQDSWTVGIVVNDSLRQLDKYRSHWRQVYTVQVTMKSGVTKYPRVLMDHNGTTPYCMEKDVERAIAEHTQTLTEAIRNIIY